MKKTIKIIIGIVLILLIGWLGIKFALNFVVKKMGNEMASSIQVKSDGKSVQITQKGSADSELPPALSSNYPENLPEGWEKNAPTGKFNGKVWKFKKAGVNELLSKPGKHLFVEIYGQETSKNINPNFSFSEPHIKIHFPGNPGEYEINTKYYSVTFYSPPSLNLVATSGSISTREKGEFILGTLSASYNSDYYVYGTFRFPKIKAK